MALRKPSPPRSLDDFVAGVPAAAPALAVVPPPDVRGPELPSDGGAGETKTTAPGSGTASRSDRPLATGSVAAHGRSRADDVDGGPRRRGIAERRTTEDKGRLTVYVDTQTASKLRRYCFERGLNISDECAKAIEQHVRELTI